MTPRETFAIFTGDAIRRRRDRQHGLWTAWHVAAFERQKRLPPLAPMLRKLEPVRVMSPKQLRNAVLSMAHALGATVTIRKKGEG